jgi:peptidoglycan/xylan/chitin deacetylase (PgdA/CDA1 family)
MAAVGRRALLASIAALAVASAAFAHAPVRRAVRVPILMYHLVGPDGPTDPPITRALTVSARVFAAQMEWLQHVGFHAVSMRQLYDALELGGTLPSHPVAITFDDGYRDVLWYAAPLLHRLHMAATAFVITGRIDGPDPSFLTWPELDRLEALGVAIGSHTVHHLELTRLSIAQAQYELGASRRALQTRLHRPVRWFAYPAGRFDLQAEELVRRAGYLLALTTVPGSLQSGAQPYALRRYEILNTTGLAGLKALLGSTGH